MWILILQFHSFITCRQLVFRLPVIRLSTAEIYPRFLILVRYFVRWESQKKKITYINNKKVMTKKAPANIEKKIKDPVSEMKIHRECLKKQKMNEKIYEDFKINQPSKIGFHADKPNNNPFLLMKYKSQGKNINGVDIDEKLDNDMQKTVLTDEINDKLKTVTQVPKDKWQFPQTSNQQIGWYAQNLKDSSKFVHKRQGCNQTHYADNYYTMKHTSLFSNHNQK